MESQEFTREKVFGTVQRLLHWWIGTFVIALIGLGLASKFLNSEASRLSLVPAHVFLGYGLTIGLILRLAWGGNNAAPREPAQKIAYAAFYGALAVSAISGICLAAMHFDTGPLADLFFDDFTYHNLFLNLHNVVLYLASLFTLAHFVGMISHERKTGLPIAQAMVSGYQYRMKQKKREES